MAPRLLLCLALTLAGQSLLAQDRLAIPMRYTHIAIKYGMDPEALYRDALDKTGQQSDFSHGKTPWPFSLSVCSDDGCELARFNHRQELYQAAQRALNDGKSIAIGPVLLTWDSVKESLANNLWIATDPLVTLNFYARYQDGTGDVVVSDSVNGVHKIESTDSVNTVDKTVAPDHKTDNSNSVVRYHKTNNTDSVTSGYKPDPVAKDVSQPGSDTITRTQINALVDQLAPEFGLDARLVKAIVQVESNYNPSAVSAKGAVGLMQLMPATGEAYGVKRDERADPMANLKGGMAFLRDLKKNYNGDIQLMIAAYNAGETAVTRHGGKIPPYTETVHYVIRVLSNYVLQLGGSA